jgi:hypothetical protein
MTDAASKHLDLGSKREPNTTVRIQETVVTFLSDGLKKPPMKTSEINRGFIVEFILRVLIMQNEPIAQRFSIHMIVTVHLVIVDCNDEVERDGGLLSCILHVEVETPSTIK